VRKRSAYRPKPIMTNPLAYLTPAAASDAQALMLVFYTALESLAAGQNPGVDEWRSLADACNTLETLVSIGTLQHDEIMPMIRRAADAMTLASRCYHDGKAMRIDGAGLEALRDVVDAYRQCIETLTAREMFLAQIETGRRVARLQARPLQNSVVIAL